MTDLQGCGHPVSAVVSADEGTSYCRLCEDEARASKEAGPGEERPTITIRPRRGSGYLLRIGDGAVPELLSPADVVEQVALHLDARPPEAEGIPDILRVLRFVSLGRHHCKDYWHEAPDAAARRALGRMLASEPEREERSAAADALDDICRLIGAPEWEYPGQVVRDVASAVGMTVGEMRAKLHPPHPSEPREDGDG